MVRLSQNYLNVIFFCFLCVAACTSDDSIPQNDSDYSPVEVGRYWVYQVQDEHYSITDTPIISNYYFKETIGELLTATQDSKTYKLIRYKRSRTTDVWRTDSVWTVQQWPDKLIRTENNVAYIKLRFPVVSTTNWNQNEYNSLPASTVQYTKTGAPYAIASKNYDNTIQVVSTKNDSTLISLNRNVAVYAYQVGLIAKENTALAYCQSTPDCIGKGQITSGNRQKWALLETGKE